LNGALARLPSNLPAAQGGLGRGRRRHLARQLHGRPATLNNPFGPQIVSVVTSTNQQRSCARLRRLSLGMTALLLGPRLTAKARAERMAPIPERIVGSRQRKSCENPLPSGMGGKHGLDFFGLTLTAPLHCLSSDDPRDAWQGAACRGLHKTKLPRRGSQRPMKQDAARHSRGARPR
jgi:hypothetical protein